MTPEGPCYACLVFKATFTVTWLFSRRTTRVDPQRPFAQLSSTSASELVIFAQNQPQVGHLTFCPSSLVMFFVGT